MATEAVLFSPIADPHSSPGHSLPTSPGATETSHADTQLQNLNKKKKKKKSKKPKCKDGVPTVSEPQTMPEHRQPVLCISRNKHWKYISSYHGPWLQLPLEILESLLSVNIDPNNFFPRNERLQLPHQTRRSLLCCPPTSTVQSLPPPHLLDPSVPLPPPINPGVFRSVASIRRLIDEASDLAVRAANGLSSAAVNSSRSPSSASPWGTAQSLGLKSLEPPSRNIHMSSTRTHRLRVMAVQKLAAAYKSDEIAASVMVMQGASALDDLAERVLKVDPDDPDARYVHFFHEKIPSSPRQLSESTPTDVLDRLIKEHPSRLEYWRTRGIVRCFRDEYGLAVKDFTHALKETRALRKARAAHNVEAEHRTKGNKPRKKSGDTKSNGQAPLRGTSVPESYALTEEPSVSPLLHPSVSSDAPEPIEPQLLFLRAAAHLQNAVYLIEDAMLKIEDVSKIPAQDAVELKLTLMEHGRFGGVLVDNPHGPLGPRDSPRLEAYRAEMSNPSLREVITGLVRKSIRDHEKFITYFDTVGGSLPIFDGDLAKRIESAFLLSESLRPGNHNYSPPLPENPGIFTTYHPLLVESHFSLLICHLILGDFAALLSAFQRVAALIDGLEGYPVFLPARSMAQAEFIEILERLASGWSSGQKPHSLSQKRLAIEAPPESISVPSSGPPRLFIAHAPPQQDSASTTRTTSPVEYITMDDAKLKGKTSDSDRRLLTGVASSSTSRSHQPLVTEGFPAEDGCKIKAIQNLDYARMLLAPVAARQKQKAEDGASEKANGGGPLDGNPGKKPLSINIPLHGPRVDIVLAWLGAVHLPDMEDAAR